MRTSKILAAFGALLLASSGASAAVEFDVSFPPPDADPAPEIDLSITLTDGTGSIISVMAFDWLLNGANVPLSAVEQPASNGPAPGPALVCYDPTNNQFMCDFGAAEAVGSQLSNDVGVHWLWDFTGAVADGTYDLGRFTFTSDALGFVSIGNCQIYDANLNTVPCSSDSGFVGPAPEPTTAALLGLGLLGLAGWRKNRQ